jgi:hypothetical protein
MQHTRFLRYLIVYLLVSFVFLSAKAQNRCQQLFAVTKNQSEIILDTLVAVEKRLSDFLQTRSGILLDPTIAKQYAKVNLLFEDVVNQISLDNSASTALFEKLFTELETLEISGMILAMKTKADLPVLMENPLLLRPGLLYTVTGLDPHVRRVSFSEEVLADIFWSPQPLMQRAVTLIHKALQRGRSHTTDSSGIEPFTHDKSVFKVRITGSVVGAIRVAGFFNGEDFHVVAWSNESNHNAHASSRVTRQVNDIRDTFFRTGHY